MAFISKLDRQSQRARITAARNRRELVAAGFTRRDLVKMGLVTASGMLIPKSGLSASGPGKGGGGGGKGGGGGSRGPNRPKSPPTTPFVEEMPIPPIKQPVAALTPECEENPLPGEGRKRGHQGLTRFPPVVYYERPQQEGQMIMHPELPVQTIWGYDGIFPGPTIIARYGQPSVVRNFNQLPANNGGFGIASTSTHLHNGHTPSESDGFPCDFYGRGQFYDQHYPNVLPGILSNHPDTGDIREALSTAWVHDHRVDFTAQNVYKGLVGFQLYFNEFDTGDETTGFRLPSGTFDVPMAFADKVFDEETGELFFDLMSLDGIVGDKFLVNGKIQPFFRVHPRRYRLRWLNTGPSRFYQFFLTDPQNLGVRNRFFQISNDGNLLPNAVEVDSVTIAVAERADVIIDFSKFAGKSIYLENRLQQTDGRGPDKLLPAGRGVNVVRFDVVLPPVADDSLPVTAATRFYDLPDIEEPRITRHFRFERKNGQWAINSKFFNCEEGRFRVKQNTAERWVLINKSGAWEHPIHIHVEEFQFVKIDGKPVPPGSVLRSRKDVVRLKRNSKVEFVIRFRDFLGRYPMHCHNVVHEDHSMMLRFDIDTEGDRKTAP